MILGAEESTIGSTKHPRNSKDGGIIANVQSQTMFIESKNKKPQKQQVGEDC